MDKPFKVWYCDICGTPITSMNEGMLTWEKDNSGKSYDFKVVHKNNRANGIGCDNMSVPNSAELSWLIGENGLIFFTSFLSTGNAISGNCGNGVRDIDKFIDLMRRFQTPYYEEARKYFETDITKDLLSDSNEISAYLPKALENIIEKNKD